MKSIYKADLKNAAAVISRLNYFGICSASIMDLSECSEFMAFCPYEEKNTGILWWNEATMGDNCSVTDKCNARLIAIAFMITMPKDMVPEL